MHRRSVLRGRQQSVWLALSYRFPSRSDVCAVHQTFGDAMRRWPGDDWFKVETRGPVTYYSKVHDLHLEEWPLE